MCWPLTSDVKNIFTRELSHFILLKPAWDEIVPLISGKGVLAIAHDATLMTKIHQAAYDFEYIQKPIRTHCEQWRLGFPRLFGLNDTTLIDLMEDFPKEDAMRSLFHIKKLNLSKCGEIRGLVGEEGEELLLIHPVCTKKCGVEALKSLECSMRESLHEAIIRALETRKTTKEWHAQHVSQAIAVTLLVEWTRHVDEALAGENPALGLANSLDLIKAELKLMVESIPSLADPLQLAKARVAATLLFRMVLTTEALLGAKSKAEAGNLWLNTFKFYWRNNTIIVRCNDDFVEYGYEFHGCHPYLISMPEQWSIYPLAMASFTHLITGLVSGPAGTGKSETLRDIAILLGKPYVILNCSPETTVDMLDNLVHDVAYSGGILILDEANRLQLEKKYLESYVKMIELRAAGCKELYENGKKMAIAPSFSTLSTINPGYTSDFNLSGYTTASITLPNIRTLTEGMLYLKGFVNARELSAVIMDSVNELKEKLSKAPQYDFGIRKIKKILDIMIALKTKHGLSDADAIPQAIHATVWMGLGKGDLKLYDDIMKARFKEAAELKVFNPSLFKALAEAPEKLSERVVHQLTALHCAMEHGESVLLLTNDDVLLQVLAKVLAKLYPANVSPIHTIDINKPYEQLYGERKGDVWVPGSIENILMSLPDNSTAWVLLKGTLDAMKAEPLNSLIDSARCFVTPQASKKVLPAVKLIFQTPTVMNLSPAFISRACTFNFI